MQISLTFKNIDPSDPLKAYVQEKFDRLDKMLDKPAEAHVVLSVEKIRHIVEINLSCDGLRIHGKEASENMYASIDTLADKLKLQVKKTKKNSSGTWPEINKASKIPVQNLAPPMAWPIRQFRGKDRR